MADISYILHENIIVLVYALLVLGIGYFFVRYAVRDSRLSKS